VQQSSYKSCFVKAFDAATNVGAVSLVARVTLYLFFHEFNFRILGILMSDAQSAQLQSRGLLCAVERSLGDPCAIRFHVFKILFFMVEMVIMNNIFHFF